MQNVVSLTFGTDVPRACAYRLQVYLVVGGSQGDKKGASPQDSLLAVMRLYISVELSYLFHHHLLCAAFTVVQRVAHYVYTLVQALLSAVALA